MAWENVYDLEFRSQQNNDKYNLYFKRDLPSTPTTIKLDGTSTPVQIEYPEFDRFDVVRGSGLTINLLSTGSFALTNLFDAGDQTVKLLLQKNGNNIWWGWLENEQYQEPYTEYENYPVTLYANDGFSLLDRKLYVDSSGNNYTGISSQWDVLKRCFDKLELLSDIGDVVLAMSTTSDDVTIQPSGSIFHSTYVKNENYYNEDGEPETCRKVVEMILSEYGAFVQMVGEDIFISDVHTFADPSSTISFKKFHSSWMGYWKTENDLTLTDINDLGYYQTGGTYKLIPGTNNLEVRYNKYKADIGDSDLDNENKITSTSAWYHNTNGSNDFYEISASHIEWIGDYDDGYLWGTKQEVGEEPEYQLAIENLDLGGAGYTTTYLPWLTTYLSGSYIIGNDEWYLRIKGKLKGLTLSDPYNSDTGPSNHDACFYTIGAVITIGDKMYDSFSDIWVDSGSISGARTNISIYGGDRDTKAQNVWYDFRHYNGYSGFNSIAPETKDEGYLLGLPNGTSGYLTMSFTDYIIAYRRTDTGAQVDNGYTEEVRKILIKDIEADVVRKVSLDEDTEDPIYKGYISSSWIKNKQEYKIYHGNSDVETPCDNGALLYLSSGDYYNITEWTRNGVTDSIENLLLRSYLSNEGRATRQLNVTLNNTTGKIIPRLVDETYLSGSIFMACGCNIDLADESMEVTLKEIKQDVEVFS